MIPSRFGKQSLLMFEGFTYSLRYKTVNGEHYYCSSRLTKACRARCGNSRRERYGDAIRSITIHRRPTSSGMGRTIEYKTSNTCKCN